MKNTTIAQLIFVLIMLTALGACQKANNVSQAELIGKWVETSNPCVYGTDCFSLQFTSDNRIVENLPYTNTGTYQLNGGNITIPDSIIWNMTVNSSGKATYQITGNGDQITIINFWHEIYTTGGPVQRSLFLKKIR